MIARNRFALRMAIVFSAVVLMLLLLLFSFSRNFKPMDAGPAIAGVLDLKNKPIPAGEVLSLDGDWQVYWGVLLTPDNFLNADAKLPAQAQIMNATANWSRFFSNPLSRRSGVATYRLKVENFPMRGILGLKKSNIRSASQIFINGQVVLQDGQTGTPGTGYRPGNSSQIGYFENQDNKLDIVVQVANFDTFQGGVVSPLQIGSPSDLISQNKRLFAFEFGSILLILTMSLLNLLLFLLSAAFKSHHLKRRDYAPLLLALYGMMTTLTISMLGERVFQTFLPGIPLQSLLFINGISANLSVVLYMTYFYAVGVLIAPHPAIWGVGLVNTFYLFILFTPWRSFYFNGAHVLVIYYVTLLLWLDISMIFHLIRSSRATLHSWEAVLLSIGVILINVYEINSGIYTMGAVRNLHLSFVSLLSFSIFMFSLVAYQLFQDQKAYQESRLAVVQRENEVIAMEYAFLRAQINPHFLYNALTAIISVSQRDGSEGAKLLTEFSHFLHSSFDLSSQGQLVPLKKELEILKAYLDIEKLRYGSKLKIELEVEPGFNHVMVPGLSIQPLVENAINHGLFARDITGTVWLSIRHVGKKLRVEVKDLGPGISDQVIQRILQTPKEPDDWATIRNLSEGGPRKGIGLTNIQRRLMHLFGAGLSIVSTAGLGTTVSFEVPLNDSGQVEF